jgi:hypothetical protein
MPGSKTGHKKDQILKQKFRNRQLPPATAELPRPSIMREQRKNMGDTTKEGFKRGVTVTCNIKITLSHQNKKAEYHNLPSDTNLCEPPRIKISLRNRSLSRVIKVTSSIDHRREAGGRRVNNLAEGGEKDGTLRRPARADKENVLEVLRPPEPAAGADGQKALMEAPQSSQVIGAVWKLPQSGQQ